MSFFKSVEQNMRGYLISSLILDIGVLLMWIKHRDMNTLIESLLIAPSILFILMCIFIFLLGSKDVNEVESE